MSQKFTFIDLFSGIGGFHLALKNNGGECLGFSEIDNDAIKSYCHNFKEKESKNYSDITKIEELPSHDLLTAGVPCQSWSIAGRNLGFDDDRGQLWNDTIYLLQKAKPKAFIFENVKGLVDPRNKEALCYILDRIRGAGYHADFHVINSHDFGVPQNRVRIYIIGFKNKRYFNKFRLPTKVIERKTLAEFLGEKTLVARHDIEVQKDFFGGGASKKSMSLSSRNGFNSYFLFNDIRNGDTTIHSWDIIETTERQKSICYLLLKNRRKSRYGCLDGNPLSLEHFKSLDPLITKKELSELVKLEILKKEEYLFEVNKHNKIDLSFEEQICINQARDRKIIIDEMKINRELKLKRISIKKTLESLKKKKLITCIEIRYDFKNTKISTGLFGVNRIFLPNSDIFPTLVASDTNDFISTVDLNPLDKISYRNDFLKKIYNNSSYRKITKEEACLIQGFPEDFYLPEARARWMKLIGNSVSVPVIEKLCGSLVETGVFD
jgi:DNA (cytosine-5)-methyltransferase 1